MTDSIIQIENVHKEYKVLEGKNVKALDGVSLEIGKMNSSALWGPRAAARPPFSTSWRGSNPSTAAR